MNVIESDLEERVPAMAAGQGGGDDRKLVVTLGVEAATATRRMAEEMGTTPTEVVRRGLSALQMLHELSDNEELMIRNRRDGSLERLRFLWTY